MLVELQPNRFHACYIGPWNTGALITRCVRDPGEMSGYGRYHLTKQGCAITGQFTGTRDDATAAARRAISRLLERQTQAAQKTIDRV
jgi:hypothetical protein